MMQPVKLSTGDVVVFKSFLSHKADKTFNETLRGDVKMERDLTGNMVVSEMPVLNFDRAVEAVLLLVIDSVQSKEGVNTVPMVEK